MKRMSLSYINALLAALPDSAEFSILWKGGHRHEYIARDIPRWNRRLTNATTGTEVFLPFLDPKFQLVSIDIEAFKIERTSADSAVKSDASIDGLERD